MQYLRGKGECLELVRFVNKVTGKWKFEERRVVIRRDWRVKRGFVEVESRNIGT